jgi:hypothetical protein
MDETLKDRLKQLKAEGHGYAKASSPEFAEGLTGEQQQEACRAGIGAAWTFTEAEAE